jgi:hypothetical protein
VSAFAQGARDASPQRVSRNPANPVRVDAVVTHSKGHQVTNLRSKGIKIAGGGRPRTITNFSFISVAAPVGEETLAQPPPPGVTPVPLTRLRHEQVRRTIAIRRGELCCAVAIWR